MLLINRSLIRSKSAQSRIRLCKSKHIFMVKKQSLTPKQQYTVEINMTAMRMRRQLMKKPAIALKLQRGNMSHPRSLSVSVFTSKRNLDHLLSLSAGFISVIDVHLLNIVSSPTIHQEVGRGPVSGASHLSFSQPQAFLLKVDAVSINDLASVSVRSPIAADLGTMTIWMMQMKTKTSEEQATYAPNLESTCLEYCSRKEEGKKSHQLIHTWPQLTFGLRFVS